MSNRVSRDESNQAQEGQGSVWTSFSDLFTSLGVIFLILFVVAMLKYSVGSMQSAKKAKESQEYLEGKIPDEVKRKSAERQAKLKKGLNRIESYRAEISQRQAELNRMVSGLSKHEGLVEQLLSDEKKSQAVLANINKVIAQKNKKIASQIAEEKSLQAELKKKKADQKALERRLAANNQKAKALESALKNAGKVAINLEKQVNAKVSKARLLEEQLRAEEGQRKKLEIKRQREILAATQNVEQLEKKLSERLKRNKKLKNRVASMEVATSQSEAKIKSLQKAQRQMAAKSRVVEDKFKVAIQAKEKAVAKLNSRIKTQEAEIAKRTQASQKLEQKLKGLNQRLALESKKSQGQINQLSTRVSKLSAGLKSKQAQIAKLKTEVAKRSGATKDADLRLAKLNAEIKKVKAQAAAKTRQAELKTQAFEIATQKLSKENLELKKKVKSTMVTNSNGAALQRQLAALESKIGRSKTKEKEGKSEIARLNGTIRLLKTKNKCPAVPEGTLAKKSTEAPEKSWWSTFAGNSKVSTGVSNSKMSTAEPTKEADDLRGALADAKSEIVELQEELVDLKKAGRSSLPKTVGSNFVPERRLASISSTSSSKMRKKIAQRLSKRFKKIDVDVKTNMETGSLTLFMDEAFLFNRNSAELSNSVQTKLAQVFPAYVEEIFGDSEVMRSIESVNVIGHASPRYGGKYVDPAAENPEAFQHNLMLSTNRAVSIVSFVLGPQFKNFSHRSEFQRKVRASGKGYAQPIKFDPVRFPNRDGSKRTCGRYDCRRSRRVEIQFTLKGEAVSQVTPSIRFYPSMPKIESKISSR